VYDSLIVVPHTIYKQWQDTIENQTTLKAHFLKSQRDLDKDNLLTSLEGSHCTLISNTLLQSFLTNLQARAQPQQPSWRRVFFDEADTIKISGGCQKPIANMTWYVTASYTNMLCVNQYYHSYIIRQLTPSILESLDPEIQEMLQQYIDNHPNVTFFRTTSSNYFTDIRSSHPLRGHLVVKSSKAFLEQSIQLPSLHQQIIRCQTPLSQQLLDQAIPPQIETLLHAGDISGALMSLGVSSHTPLTIVDAVTEFRKKELDRLKRLYTFKEEETYISTQAKETALAALQYKIQTAEQQLQALQTRIQEATKESCSICFETPTEPVLVPCCAKMFCGNCILSWMTRTPACPLCRTSFHPSELKRIGQEFRGTRHSLPKKLDALLQILQEHPNGKFLIFSRYENPLLSIQETIQDHYPTATLHGNKDAISRILSDFESGKYKILLLNSRQAAAGMNIPSANPFTQNGNGRRKTNSWTCLSPRENHPSSFHKASSSERMNIRTNLLKVRRTEYRICMAEPNRMSSIQLPQIGKRNSFFSLTSTFNNSLRTDFRRNIHPNICVHSWYHITKECIPAII
jgi:hypothetical protein